MTQISSATHEAFNQSPPFEDVDLFALDGPLAEAVAANGGGAVANELSQFGKHWGSAAMAARGRIANENTPKLRTFDSRGNRRDEVEFHPAYHEHGAQRACRPAQFDVGYARQAGGCAVGSGARGKVLCRDPG
jgi:putative acyl-CoA dehydrogenase